MQIQIPKIQCALALSDRMEKERKEKEKKMKRKRVDNIKPVKHAEYEYWPGCWASGSLIGKV